MTVSAHSGGGRRTFFRLSCSAFASPPSQRHATCDMVRPELDHHLLTPSYSHTYTGHASSAALAPPAPIQAAHLDLDLTPERRRRAEPNTPSKSSHVAARGRSTESPQASQGGSRRHQAGQATGKHGMQFYYCNMGTYLRVFSSGIEAFA